MLNTGAEYGSYLLSTLCSRYSRFYKAKQLRANPVKGFIFPSACGSAVCTETCLVNLPFATFSALASQPSIWSTAPLASLPSREGEILSCLTHCSVAGSWTCWEVPHSSKGKRVENRSKFAVLHLDCLIIYLYTQAQDGNVRKVHFCPVPYSPLFLG